MNNFYFCRYCVCLTACFIDKWTNWITVLESCLGIKYHPKSSQTSVCFRLFNSLPSHCLKFDLIINHQKVKSTCYPKHVHWQQALRNHISFILCVFHAWILSVTFHFPFFLSLLETFHYLFFILPQLFLSFCNCHVCFCLND